MDQVFIKAIPVIKKLKHAGHEAYFVGGSVRDFLLGRSIGDIDIATSATPNEIIQLFQKTVDVGKEHGTIIVVTDDESYEVTTFRSEGTYTDNRRPDEVTFIKSLREDLKRRDFTINAMAMTESGDIIDYFNGKEHLQEKIIQTVGNPQERFSEDALRMLRAARFSSQLSFSIHPTTISAMKKYSRKLHLISVERKTIEFEKLFKGNNVSYAINVLKETNVFSALPGLEKNANELIELSLLVDGAKLQSRSQLWAAICIFVHVEQHDSFLQKWKLPNKIIKRVGQISKGWHETTSGWNKKTLYDFGLDIALDIEHLRIILEDKTDESSILVSVYNELPIRSKRDLALSGSDLLKIMNKKPGKWVSEILDNMELEVLNGTVLNTPATLKEWVLQCKMRQEKNC